MSQPSFDNSLPMLLYRALDAVMPDHRRLFAEFGLTEQQWRILRVLWLTRSTSSVDLAARTLLTPQSIVGILDRLEARGLVTRLRSTKDRRYVRVTATAEGRRLQAEILPKVEAVHAKHSELLDPIENRELQRLLLKLASRADLGLVSQRTGAGRAV